MTRGSLLTVSTFVFSATIALSPRADAANPTTAECVAAADSSLQLRDQHKLRAARAQMLVCASASCPAAVQSECLRRVDQTNAAIPTIVFEAKDAAGNDLSNVRVDMDGQPLTDRLDGSSLQVDPGEHHFRFTGSGGIVVDKTIVMREGEKERRERVVVAVAAAPVATPVQAAPAAAATSALEASSEDPGASRRTIAYVVGGVGVVGLAIGTVFGLIASSSASSSKNECSATSCSNYGQSLSDYNSASSDATISTVGFVVGGLALATGAVLFFTAPSSAPASGSTGPRWQFSPAVGGTGLGLSVKGAL
jgi:hypothetical protein